MSQKNQIKWKARTRGNTGKAKAITIQVDTFDKNVNNVKYHSVTVNPQNVAVMPDK